MIFSVNASDNNSLASTEFNQLGSDFMHFNQKCDKKNYREYIETQDDDTFESTHNRVSIEFFTITKDRILDDSHTVMDPNKPPAKFTSKLKVMSLTSDWKTSNDLSCVEVHYCAMG